MGYICSIDEAGKRRQIMEDNTFLQFRISIQACEWWLRKLTCILPEAFCKILKGFSDLDIFWKTKITSVCLGIFLFVLFFLFLPFPLTANHDIEN